MKKKIYLLATVLMMALASPALMAKDAKPLTLTEQQQVRLEQIERRVVEIKSIDKSTLSRQERKDLRQELSKMKKEARATNGGGVYLSVGAIIIIILLLILIL